MKNTSDLDEEGNTISREYSYTLDESNEVNNHMNDYVVHPAFRDGTTTHYMNGEWDEEVSGFWVAKYEAGFQANTITNNNGTLSTTISNSGDEVVYSDLKYTSYNGRYIINALGQDLSSTEYLNQNLSYPVFLPLTYSYNHICRGDSYVLAQAIDTASNFYGLSSSTTDSHMMKNSEWGTVVYLSQSKYGRDGTEIITNNYYTSEESPYRVVITGLAGTSTSAESTTNISNVYAYNTENGTKSSTTGNITGVYDMDGGSYEAIAGYVLNGDSHLTSTGVSGGSSGGLMGATSIANSNGYQTLSTRNYTIYPWDLNNDLNINNYNFYKSLLSSNYAYGDAILETSIQGSEYNSWNNAGSTFPDYLGPFFYRGGYYNNNNVLYSYSRDNGYSHYAHSFRTILISE